MTSLKDHHQGIEGDGWFWPHDGERARAVPGLLRATVDDPIELVLLQPMLNTHDEWMQGSASGTTGPAAYGYIGNTAVTLLNLRVTGTNHTLGNPLATRETISADTAALGAHLPVVRRRDGSAALVADAVVAELELLDEWLGRPGLRISMERPEGNSRFSAATVRYEYPDTLRAAVAGGHIELQGEWTLPSYDHDVVGIPSGTLLRVTSDLEADFHEPMEHVAAIQLLLSLITSSAPDLQNFRLHHSERRVEGGDGVFLYDVVTLVSGWARRRPGRHAGPLESPFSKRRLALLTFEEIGGIDGLGRWVELSTDLRVVLSMLTSAAFADELPLENRFLNLCAAAEGLHRHWNPTTDEAEEAARRRRDAILQRADSTGERRLLKKALRYAHEPSLAERLRGLASEVPATAKALTDDAVIQWSDAATWTRNQLAHPNAPGEVRKREEAGLHPAGGLDYIALAHAVYWITAAALLERLGVPDRLLAERIDDHELSWSNQQARASIRRWKQTREGAGFVEP